MKTPALPLSVDLTISGSSWPIPKLDFLIIRADIINISPVKAQPTETTALLNGNEHPFSFMGLKLSRRQEN